MSRTRDEHARALATGEGILGADALALPVSRWPRWSRVRYAGDDDCAWCLAAAAEYAGTDHPPAPAPGGPS